MLYRKQLHEPDISFFEVTIIGDVNDADFVTQRNQYSEEEFLERLPYLKVLCSHFDGHKLEQLHYCFQKTEGHGCQCEGYFYDRCQIRKCPDFINNLKVSLLDEMIGIPSFEGNMCHSLEAVSVRFFDRDGKVYLIDIEV